MFFPIRVTFLFFQVALTCDHPLVLLDAASASDPQLVQMQLMKNTRRQRQTPNPSSSANPNLTSNSSAGLPSPSVRALNNTIPASPSMFASVF